MIQYNQGISIERSAMAGHFSHALQYNKKKDSHKIRLSFYNFSINVCDNSLIFFFGSFNGFQADMRHFVTLECRNYVQVEIKRVVFR